jgi:hypothetical protein
LLPTEHALGSTVAALAAAPFVRDPKKLALFWAFAVGQDVDHYLWYVWRFHDPSLSRAYHYFRSRYPGPGREAGEKEENRAFHGPLPLLVVGAATLRFPWLRPVFAAMAFHALLDTVNEYVLLPRLRRRLRAQTARTDPAQPDLVHSGSGYQSPG